MCQISRRRFLRSSVTAACVTSLTDIGSSGSFSAIAAPASGTAEHTASPAPLSLKKGLVLDMLPRRLSYSDRFQDGQGRRL